MGEFRDDPLTDEEIEALVKKMNAHALVSQEELEDRAQEIQAALDEAEKERQAELERVQEEIEQRNRDAQKPVDFQEFAEALGIPYEPSPEPEPPVLEEQPERPLAPADQKTEPPYFQPGPAYQPVDYAADPE